MTLNYLDWLIIVAYFGVTLSIGLWFSKRAGRSLTDYFISGRSLPWWIAGTSMVATTFAADTPLAVTGLVAKNGLAGNWFWWSFALGGMFTVFVYARMWRRAEVLTDVELVELRYAGKPAAGLRFVRALYIALVVNPIIIGWVTGAMLTILKETVLSGAGPILGDGRWDDWLIIIACLTVVGIYCSLSGLWGVAITDFIQFFVAMAGCIILAYVAVEHIGGMEALQTKVAANFGDGQAFRFLPDFQAADPWMPLHIFMIFLFVQWWATWYPGAEPGGGGYIVQRMAACKDERHALLATLWYQVAHYCIRPWPWLLVAFVALAAYPEIRQAGLGQPVPGYDGLKPDSGFAWVIRDMSPHGLRGLMLVTFFAAFMSTISTQMNWGASYLMRDVYQRFIAPTASDRQLTNVSRFVSLGVLFIGGFVAYQMRDVSVDDAWKLLVALGAGTGAVFMLRWFWWRINAWSEIVAMIASLVYFLIISRLLPQWVTDDPTGETALGRFAKFVEPSEVQGFVVAVLTIVTWLIVTFLTPSESDQTLLAFFRKVRPGGPGWKPIAAQAPDVEVDRHLGWAILAAVIAAGMVYLTIPAIGMLLFGQNLRGIICLLGAAGCALMVFFLTRRIGWKNIV
ncbi:MAG: Na+:solute symporter [Planctomycetaceae bacterium]|nr:Na+:solute symporter [Planctomycetaceae bacterium]